MDRSIVEQCDKLSGGRSSAAYGVRALLVEPAYTSTGFEANSPRPDAPLQVYADQRRAFDRMMETAITLAPTPPSSPR